MIDIAIKLLLLSASGLPLLLAIPALRGRLHWPAHVALLPAIVLLFIPGSLYIDLPWMFWGSFGMGIDTVSRWWLAMSVVIWVVSGKFLIARGGYGACNRRTTLFLLTLAGQMGAVMATDMVSYFTFMTLMGYAFIGLLFADDNEQVRRAGRIYLLLMILADIALFEALLIAAETTEDIRFEAVARAITLSPSPALYLSMVIVGFALKVGFWPLHVWFPLAYGSSRPPVSFLLWMVPVATGLFGAVRWLPLGEITAPIAGMLLQAIGAVGILYAFMFGLKRAKWKQLTAYVATIASSIFAMGLGTGLTNPVFWNKYAADSVPAFIGLMGLWLAIMVASFAWLEKKKGSPPETRMSGGAEFWFERWQDAVISWGLRAGNDTLSGLHAAWLARWGIFWEARTWLKMFDAGESFFQRWVVAATLFLLLGMVFVALLLLDAMPIL